MRINEALVLRMQVVPGKLEFFQQRALVVGDKDIRGLDQANEYFPPLG
jgi:hypothetical protein